MRRAVEILLVEDNPGDARLTREVLREGRVPNHLTVVEDGEEAMAYLRNEGAFTQAARPDLILLDLDLPRKGGRELLAEIRQDSELTRIPVLVLTGSRDERDVRSSYDLYANCYIAKPFSTEEYQTIVRSIERFWLETAALPAG